MRRNLPGSLRRYTGPSLLLIGGSCLPVAYRMGLDEPRPADPPDEYPRDLVTLRHDCRRAMAVADCSQCRLFPCAMADF